MGRIQLSRSLSLIAIYYRIGTLGNVRQKHDVIYFLVWNRMIFFEFRPFFRSKHSHTLLVFGIDDGRYTRQVINVHGYSYADAFRAFTWTFLEIFGAPYFSRFDLFASRPHRRSISNDLVLLKVLKLCFLKSEKISGDNAKEIMRLS